MYGGGQEEEHRGAGNLELADEQRSLSQRVGFSGPSKTSTSYSTDTGEALGGYLG